MGAMPKRVLFLCTGNYYRSRFAELLFNHRAAEMKLDWLADSRGLALELGAFNVGPISPHTARAIERYHINCAQPHREPRQVSEAELASADLVIALKEDEHRRMLSEKHPAWPDRVEYWHVHDLDQASSELALGEIAELIETLLQRLARD
jgi:protein-tyrosine phosphatase